jgi:hypothetical protein
MPIAVRLTKRDRVDEADPAPDELSKRSLGACTDVTPEQLGVGGLGAEGRRVGRGGWRFGGHGDERFLYYSQSPPNRTKKSRLWPGPPGSSQNPPIPNVTYYVTLSREIARFQWLA